MSYYKNFKVVLSSRVFQNYLLWSYKKGIQDLTKLNFKPDFSKTDFACLLCGVGFEGTADLFIKFVTQKNAKAKIWIIDLGEEQITAVEKLVKTKYPHLDITVKRINALELESLIPKASLDWIETDGVLEFFDSPSLQKLLTVWKALLKPDGFVTTRDFSTGSGLAILTDALRVWGAKHWLGVSLYRHTKKEFAGLFNSLGYKYTEGLTPLPTFKRFSMVKK